MLAFEPNRQSHRQDESYRGRYPDQQSLIGANQPQRIAGEIAGGQFPFIKNKGLNHRRIK